MKAQHHIDPSLLPRPPKQILPRPSKQILPRPPKQTLPRQPKQYYHAHPNKYYHAHPNKHYHAHPKTNTATPTQGNTATPTQTNTATPTQTNTATPTQTNTATQSINNEQVSKLPLVYLRMTWRFVHKVSGYQNGKPAWEGAGSASIWHPLQSAVPPLTMGYHVYSPAQSLLVLDLKYIRFGKS